MGKAGQFRAQQWVTFEGSSAKNSLQGRNGGGREASEEEAAPCSQSLSIALGHAACLLAESHGLLLSWGE